MNSAEQPEAASGHPRREAPDAAPAAPGVVVATVPAVDDGVPGDAEAEAAAHPFMQRIARLRARVAERPRLAFVYRVGVGIVGGALVLAGATLLALPGPGWLTVFLGLAVLGTEFHWARNTAGWLRRQLDRCWTWWRARRSRRAQRAAASVA